MRFNQYLFEDYIPEAIEKVTKLKHLEHAEDLMIDSGMHGFHHALEALKKTNEKLKGKFNTSKVTTKFDGSPSVVFGRHPQTKKFFVGSKSVFNKEPKINYTPEDIEKNHGHAPGLVHKLKAALEHLPKITPKHGIYQGDIMHTKDDVHEHDGKYHFTPNTIMYSVPKKSEHGKAMEKSHLGIVVHTKYHGDDLENMHAGFDPDIHNFKKHKDVHLINHETGSVVHSGENEKKFDFHIQQAETAYNKAHKDTLPVINAHAALIKPYINQTVKNDEKPSVEGYRMYLMKRGEKEIASVKTAKAKQQKHELMMRELHHLEQHPDKFHSMFKIHNHLQHAKNALVASLAQSSEFEHSVGKQEVGPEGHVVIHNGHPIKLVNRSEFSKLNFLKNRD